MDDKYRALLAKIKEPGSVNPQWKGTADAMTAFAEFLTVLAEDFKKQADANLLIQKRLIHLTWLTLGLTALMFFLQFFEVFRQPQKADKNHQEERQLAP